MKKLILLSLSVLVLSAVSAQFKLPVLNYKFNALEPYFDSTTMNIHYTYHHGAYVNNLNKALEQYPNLQKKSLEELFATMDKLPSNLQTAIRNFGGGHYNHTFFWSILAPAGSTSISPNLEKILNEQFGGLDKLKEGFDKVAAGRFGSGWVWLIKDPEGKFKFLSTANQDNPLMSIINIKGKPILCLDLWEHAYYLKYQYKRADYIKAFWNVVNWEVVEKLITEP
jgi:superoxide dismutase, Fe-Mn family